MSSPNLKKYGAFSPDGTEFIVTNPQTPRPWTNYLTNEEYGAIISACAGGYSFYKDCRTDRIHRWAPENWHLDRPGRYLYIRDKSSRTYWSATWQPVRAPYEKFEARHGLGYTVIRQTANGISSELTYFVPRSEPCEIWIARLTNTSRKTRTLQIFPYIEWLIGDYHLELVYRNILNLYNRIWVDKKSQAIFAKKTAAWGDMRIRPFEGQLFFASGLPVKGYATQKDGFLGKWNTEAEPEAVRKGQMPNQALTSGEDGVAALLHEVTLQPGATKTFTILTGETDRPSQIHELLRKYRDVSNAEMELAETQAAWRARILENIRVETPDPEFNTMINTWVKYQLTICNYWSRSPSYYHEGGGGRGYRDACQDGEGIASLHSALTRKKILSVAKLIREDGTSAPGWSDTYGPYSHRPNKDHPIWLTVTVSAYIKETGEQSILLQKVPFLKDKWIKGWWIDENYKEPPKFVGETTIFDKLWRNLDFTFHDTDERGLPRIGHADWNDAIDAAGIKHKGESVWLAQALVRSLKVLAELANLMDEKEKAQELLRRAQVMTERIEKVAWDGEWYKRGFTDDGTVYGSKENKEGKIFLNTQSWAILAGIPHGKQLLSVLASVDRYLDGKHGYALFYPAYSKWDARLGRISMFAEGTKENAAVFCHAATFMIVANCLAGRGLKAYQAMKKIMPNAQKDYDLYKTEPYAYAEYLVGPEHPYLYGEGAFTWITGTAAWTFMAATEWLLGARREYNGLRIDPCLPPQWKKCKITRPFRGDIYDISIENPDGLEKGVREVWVDGRRMEGNLIRPFGDGKTHAVRVVMGKPATSSVTTSATIATPVVIARNAVTKQSQGV